MDEFSIDFYELKKGFYQFSFGSDGIDRLGILATNTTPFIFIQNSKTLHPQSY